MKKEIRPRTPREEFDKFRRKLLKENNIEHLICARCGEWRISVHLHHIKELVHGGENTTDNLIPLCYRCHNEWDWWDDGKFDFGTFLLTPSISGISKVFFGKTAISKQSLLVYRKGQWVVRSCDWADMYCDGEDDEQYKEELRRQNRIFSTYPYSDDAEMFGKYGEVPAPVVLEELALVTVDTPLYGHIKSRCNDLKCKEA